MKRISARIISLVLVFGQLVDARPVAGAYPEISSSFFTKSPVKLGIFEQEALANPAESPRLPFSGVRIEINEMVDGFLHFVVGKIRQRRTEMWMNVMQHAKISDVPRTSLIYFEKNPGPAQLPVVMKILRGVYLSLADMLQVWGDAHSVRFEEFLFSILRTDANLVDQASFEIVDRLMALQSQSDLTWAARATRAGIKRTTLMAIKKRRQIGLRALFRLLFSFQNQIKTDPLLEPSPNVKPQKSTALVLAGPFKFQVGQIVYGPDGRCRILRKDIDPTHGLKVTVRLLDWFMPVTNGYKLAEISYMGHLLSDFSLQSRPDSDNRLRQYSLDLLGIKDLSTEAELKTAYRQAVLKYSQDKVTAELEAQGLHGDDINSHPLFKKAGRRSIAVQQAFRLLWYEMTGELPRNLINNPKSLREKYSPQIQKTSTARTASSGRRHMEVLKDLLELPQGTLTERMLKAIELALEGWSYRVIGNKLGSSEYAVSELLRVAKKKLGKEAPQAAAAAAGSSSALKDASPADEGSIIKDEVKLSRAA